MNNTPRLYRLWDAGQRHLAALRYVPARIALETAEALAFTQRDARSLARLYLPLLEARRQIRYHAAEGAIIIGIPNEPASRAFIQQPAGTLLLRVAPTQSAKAEARRCLRRVEYASRRTGSWLETLFILERGTGARLCAPRAATFDGGLPIRWTRHPLALIPPATDPAFQAPLPPPLPPLSACTSGPLHALARESLLIAWEALALRWQHRHPPTSCTPWQEIAWLRRALRIDPACEPITMRLIALAETIDNRGLGVPPVFE